MARQEDFRRRERVNFYQKWTLIYQFWNQEFFEKHRTDWKRDSFPDAQTILDQELEAALSDDSPSEKWPPGMLVSDVNPWSILETVTVTNWDVINLEKEIHISELRHHDLELIKKEIDFVYWKAKVDIERAQFKDKYGISCIGDPDPFNVEKAGEAWYDLMHYKIKNQFTKADFSPLSRAVGLWLWDYKSQKTCSDEGAAEAFRKRYGGVDRFPKKYRDRNYCLLELLNTTRRCIQEASFLAFNSK